MWSGSSYADGDAAPLALRRGSPYCHHHRVRCAGRTQAGTRCTLTSSSEHAHAEPLRKGSALCAHHQGQLSEQQQDPSQGSCAEEADVYELYECSECGELCALKAGEPCQHACGAAEDWDSDNHYNVSSILSDDHV